MKKKVLLIATFPPPVHGSAVVSQQIKESMLIQDSFDFDYVNLSTSRALHEPKNYLLKLARFLRNFSRTFRLLLTHRYDLCYCALTCHGGCFLRDAPFVLICKLFRHKMVIHMHNKGVSLDVDKPIFCWLYPAVYRHAKVMLLSWHLYNDVSRVVRKEDVLICPNGIKPCKHVCQEQQTSAVPRILFLSNMLVAKGVILLLDVLQMLNERGIPFMADFVGAPTHEIDCERFENECRSRGLSYCATFHGPKYGEEKESFWKSADIFVHPTFNDAFPLVLLEAMQHTLPIVASAEGGIPDIVTDKETGFVVKKGSVNAFADALEKLLTNFELRQRMGEAGRRKFEAQFTEKQFEQAFVSCLVTAMDSELCILNAEST